MSTPIVHVEIPVRNMARARKFYAGVFGWAFKAFSPRYVMFTTGEGEKVGGALVKTELKELPADGGVTVYVRTDSIKDALARVKACEGKVLQKRTEIGGDNGFIGFLRDTEGNRIGIWAAK
ncbi:MAG: VOC family protein [Planctomycetes bacterium]|nr:VOC family protein [Planctomycetota bacterium]